MESEQPFEFDVDYDPVEVTEILKSKEALILNQRISKLEQELRNTIDEFKKKIEELDIGDETMFKDLGKIKGKVYMIPHGKGLRVFGEDTKKNKEIIKEAGGTWNSTLKSWIFPLFKKEELESLGIVEESMV